MKCFYCPKEACAKIGSAKASILAALFSLGKAWEKREIYVCRKCFDTPRTSTIPENRKQEKEGI